MARHKLTKPSDAELEVLQVLWDRGPITIRDVNDALAERGRPSNQPAVATAIRVMVERGYVRVADERRPAKYAAAVDRDQTYQSLATELRQRIFGGSLKSLVRHALGGAQPTAREVEELRDLLDSTPADGDAPRRDER